jgi:hypothetical protein
MAANENRKPTAVLRAHRLGGEPPSLDERLRDTRTRKARPAVKTAAKTGGKSADAAVAPKRLKAASVRKTPAKAPARRIGVRPDGGVLLASTKAATRIVGVPQRAPRVALTTAP